MAKPKKDGEKIRINFVRKIINRHREYAEEQGQTMTLAMERIVERFLDDNDKFEK